MPDQFVRRSRVSINQRTDLEDFDRTNDSALGNLSLAMRFLVTAGLGVVRGGGLVPTVGPSMQCVLQPLGAVGQRGVGSGLIVVESDRLVTFPPSDPGNPRIDVVSIRYAEADDSFEDRWFENPPGTQFQSNVATETTSNPIVTVTQGQAAANPVAPATPVGDLALYHVTIRAGTVTILATDITRVQTDWIQPLQVRLFLPRNEDVNFNLPWTSDEIRVVTPPMAHTLLLAMCSISAGTTTLNGAPFILRLEDIDVGLVVGQTNFQLDNLSTGHAVSQIVMGVTANDILQQINPPPALLTGARRYRLRLLRQDGISGATDANIAGIVIAAVTL